MHDRARHKQIKGLHALADLTSAITGLPAAQGRRARRMAVNCAKLPELLRKATNRRPKRKAPMGQHRGSRQRVVPSGSGRLFAYVFHISGTTPQIWGVDAEFGLPVTF